MATTEEIRADLAEIVEEVAGVDADFLGGGHSAALLLSGFRVVVLAG